MDGTVNTKATDGPIRVLVVDGCELSRLALVERLSRTSGIEVVGAAGATDAPFDVTAAEPIEVVIADASLPAGSAEAICRTIRVNGHRCGCVVLANLPRPPDTSLPAGVDAYVLKELLSDTLESEIQRIGLAVRL